MSNSVFVKVSVKDELPPANKKVPVILVDGRIMEDRIMPSKYNSEQWYIHSDDRINYWLKMVELPTKEQILTIKHQMDGNPGFLAGAQYILNLLTPNKDG